MRQATGSKRTHPHNHYACPMMECCLQLFRKKATKGVKPSQSNLLEQPTGVPIESCSLPGYLKGERPCILVGNLRRFVMLPELIDRNEWLATHTYEFFHLLNAYYGSINASCSLGSCPIMRIRAKDQLVSLIWPPEFVITARECHSSRSSITTLFFSASNTLCREISAANYIDSALTWIETQIESPEKFPKSMKSNYPGEFEKKLIIPIFQLLFHVFNHIYEFHFDRITELELEPYLNGLLAHFLSFGREFGLFPGLELEPLSKFVDGLFPPPVEPYKPVALEVLSFPSGESIPQETLDQAIEDGNIP